MAGTTNGCDELRHAARRLALIDGAAWFLVLLQIFFVDLLLGADNAVINALACSHLPRGGARRAIMFGAAGAIALRLGMLAFASALLDAPFVKVIAAWMLVVIALNFCARKVPGEGHAAAGTTGPGDFLAAAAVIMFADAAMSLDNVMAVAAIARGDFWLTALGVLLTIPILAYGSLILKEILHKAPEILTFGAVVLGWAAGGMAVSDQLVANWVRSYAPALTIFAPPLAAAFVWVAGQGVARDPRDRPIQSTPSIPMSAPRLLPGRPIRRSASDSRLMEDRALGCSEAWKPFEARGRDRAGGQPRNRWTEERVVVLGVVALAALAGLILFVASFFDSLM
jgi:YjbE family integral membrane protein